MASGTIKKDGLKLLWANPNPGSSFAAQSVSLDLSPFVAALVVYEEDSNVPYRTNTSIIPVGLESASSYVAASGSGFVHVRRVTSVATTGITFSAGQRQTYNTALVNENNWQVPKYIYGIG